MPMDSKGNYHVNAQRMRASGRTSGKSPEDKGGDGMKSEAPAESGGEKVHTITEKGDGSMHSRMHDGTETDHPDHLHMLAHIGHHVSGGDKHHVAHHDGMSMHSHGIHEDGQHEETHDHENIEDLKGNLGKFFDEEEHEGEHEPEQDGGEPKIDGGY
jgi:hypothetical protein